METLEKKVHFVAGGTNVVCYDSKGNLMAYLMVGGEPYVKIDSSMDRLLNIHNVVVHNEYREYYSSHRPESFGRCDLSGVVNGRFVSSRYSFWKYAERPCTHHELASFYLAKYKACKNAIKLAEVDDD